LPIGVVRLSVQAAIPLDVLKGKVHQAPAAAHVLQQVQGSTGFGCGTPAKEGGERRCTHAHAQMRTHARTHPPTHTNGHTHMTMCALGAQRAAAGGEAAAAAPAAAATGALEGVSSFRGLRTLRAHTHNHVRSHTHTYTHTYTHLLGVAVHQLLLRQLHKLPRVDGVDALCEEGGGGGRRACN